MGGREGESQERTGRPERMNERKREVQAERIWARERYPLAILQQKAIRIITFSHFQSHTSPLFNKFNLLKLPDIVYLYTAVFMHQFHKGNLPEKFNNYFTLVSNQHSYNTRLASKATFILPLVRTNYGLFNIRFCGPKVWNSIEESLKSLSKFSFKKKLKQQLILAY